MTNLWEIEVEDDGYDGNWQDESDELTDAESLEKEESKWLEDDDLNAILPTVKIGVKLEDEGY